MEIRVFYSKGTTTNIYAKDHLSSADKEKLTAQFFKKHPLEIRAPDVYQALEKLRHGIKENHSALREFPGNWLIDAVIIIIIYMLNVF
ncbi:hypothetical protein FEM41_21680 [Jejubacter calystegiae]|uniref:Uncharacterized protein n=1 Tax=Jejubacter calystegiae TaxID=2579935 RepID=A0A4P8YPX3_9ENTR|nr:hypothetical protein [Jejubacter calystegiae]QCT22068.1 hypothetical protein FEM41_21680 [Jejubacter calystegiae]